MWTFRRMILLWQSNSCNALTVPQDAEAEVLRELLTSYFPPMISRYCLQKWVNWLSCFLIQSVPLWCDYLNFVLEHDQMVRDCLHDGISKARNLYERGLTAAGLHVADGIKLWEAYREFEQAIFQTIDLSDIQVRTCSETCLLLFIFFFFFDR